MKVVMNNAEMVPTPKKGTIIRFGDLYVTDGDAPTATRGGSWRGNDNKFLWTSATDDVFRDCFIPTTTPDKGPLQFEIDEQLNTTWYKE